MFKNKKLVANSIDKISGVSSVDGIPAPGKSRQVFQTGKIFSSYKGVIGIGKVKVVNSTKLELPSVEFESVEKELEKLDEYLMKFNASLDMSEMRDMLLFAYMSSVITGDPGIASKAENRGLEVKSAKQLIEEKQLSFLDAVVESAEMVKGYWKSENWYNMRKNAADYDQLVMRFKEIVAGREDLSKARDELNSSNVPLLVFGNESFFDVSVVERMNENGKKPMLGMGAIGFSKQQSHTAILAKKYGNALFSTQQKVANRMPDGANVIITPKVIPDIANRYITNAEIAELVVESLTAKSGEIIVNPTPEEIEKYKDVQGKVQKVLDKIQEYSSLPQSMKDGTKYELMAYVSSISDGEDVKNSNTEKIAMDRLEMRNIAEDLLLNEEQYSSDIKTTLQYSEADVHIVRIPEFTSDKNFKGLDLSEKESLEFLLDKNGQGYKILKDALKGILRQSGVDTVRRNKSGRLMVLIPNVTSKDDVDKVRDALKECMKELDSKGVEYNNRIWVGSMIENPEATKNLFEISKASSFFNIGGNDLMHNFSWLYEAHPDWFERKDSPLHGVDDDNLTGENGALYLKKEVGSKYVVRQRFIKHMRKKFPSIREKDLKHFVSVLKNNNYIYADKKGRRTHTLVNLPYDNYIDRESSIENLNGLIPEFSKDIIREALNYLEMISFKTSDIPGRDSSAKHTTQELLNSPEGMRYLIGVVGDIASEGKGFSYCGEYSIWQMARMRAMGIEKFGNAPILNPLANVFLRRISYDESVDHLNVVLDMNDPIQIEEYEKSFFKEIITEFSEEVLEDRIDNRDKNDIAVKAKSEKVRQVTETLKDTLKAMQFKPGDDFNAFLVEYKKIIKDNFDVVFEMDPSSYEEAILWYFDRCVTKIWNGSSEFDSDSEYFDVAAGVYELLHDPGRSGYRDKKVSARKIDNGMPDFQDSRFTVLKLDNGKYRYIEINSETGEKRFKEEFAQVDEQGNMYVQVDGKPLYITTDDQPFVNISSSRLLKNVSETLLSRVKSSKNDNIEVFSDYNGRCQALLIKDITKTIFYSNDDNLFQKRLHLDTFEEIKGKLESTNPELLEKIGNFLIGQILYINVDDQRYHDGKIKDQVIISVSNINKDAKLIRDAINSGKTVTFDDNSDCYIDGKRIPSLFDNVDYVEDKLKQTFKLRDEINQIVDNYKDAKAEKVIENKLKESADKQTFIRMLSDQNLEWDYGATNLSVNDLLRRGVASVDVLRVKTELTNAGFINDSGKIIKVPNRLQLRTKIDDKYIDVVMSVLSEKLNSDSRDIKVGVYPTMIDEQPRLRVSLLSNKALYGSDVLARKIDVWIDGILTKSDIKNEYYENGSVANIDLPDVGHGSNGIVRIVANFDNIVPSVNSSSDSKVIILVYKGKHMVFDSHEEANIAEFLLNDYKDQMLHMSSSDKTYARHMQYYKKYPTEALRVQDRLIETFPNESRIMEPFIMHLIREVDPVQAAQD